MQSASRGSGLALLAWLVCAAAMPLASCGGSLLSSPDMADSGAATAPLGPPGGLSVQVQLPAGTVISLANYTLKGPGGFARTDTLNFVGSDAVSIDLVNVPAGAGYTIDIGLVPVGGGACGGHAGPIDVTAGLTTAVVVTASCSGGTGTVSLTAPGPTGAPPPPAPSSSASQTPTTPLPPVGAVAVSIELPASVPLTTLDCLVTGPNGYSDKGLLTVGDSSTLDFSLTNLPVSKADTISLTGTSTDGRACSGAASFGVSAQSVSEVTVLLRCL